MTAYNQIREGQDETHLAKQISCPLVLFGLGCLGFRLDVSSADIAGFRGFLATSFGSDFFPTFCNFFLHIFWQLFALFNGTFFLFLSFFFY